MLRSMQELEEYTIAASDGTVGRVSDFYFDDRAWVIRYLVVDAGNWLKERRVLISPMSIGEASWVTRSLPVSISMEQVKNSPDIDTAKPVSRQHEMLYLGYYGYPYYWGGLGIWGDGPYPSMSMQDLPASPAGKADESERERENADIIAKRHAHDDPHLRSCHAVSGYHVHASDGEIGHVKGFLVDEQTWAIRYIIVDTSNWWMGHLVLLAPQWFKDVNWADSSITVRMSRRAVKDAPLYDAASKFERAHEASIYSHYGYPGYWNESAKREAAISAE
jgi:sporulation protein YlmC with PRC-barrel domain